MSDIDDIPFTASEITAAGGVTYPAKSAGQPPVSIKLDLRALAATEPTPYDQVLPGFLRGTVGALVSPGGTGKSIFTLEATATIACSVAGGIDLPGIGIKSSGRGVYLAGEDPIVALHHRFHDLIQHYPKAAQEAIFNNLDLHGMIDCDRDLMNDKWSDGSSISQFSSTH